MFFSYTYFVSLWGFRVRKGQPMLFIKDRVARLGHRTPTAMLAAHNVCINYWIVGPRQDYLQAAFISIEYFLMQR